jgi:hypothetical protein
MTEMDLIAECTTIFERYLSSNATHRVKLPSDCFRELVKSLFKPNQVCFVSKSLLLTVLFQFIFDKAMSWVMEHFCVNRYPQFKASRFLALS